MHFKGFGKILWLKKLSNLCIMFEWLLFQIRVEKTFKEINMIVSKISVCQKRDNYIFFIYLSNLQENIEGIILRATVLQLSLSAFEDAEILLLG